jgi:translation initiation factor eIF-2B subunit beta
MDSRQIESIEYIVEFKKKLRKKSFPNSTIIAIETAKIFRDVIKALYSGQYTMQFNDLLRVLKSLGKSFISVEPLQFCVGNIVKRILHIVREEYNKFPNLETFSQQSSENKKKRMMSITSLNLLIDYSSQKITQTPKSNYVTKFSEDFEEDGGSLNLNNDNDTGVSTDAGEMKEYVKAILTSISELIDEIESISEFIKDQSFEHINNNDVILTANHSDQLEEFFIEAAKEKKFHVIIAESAPTLK